MIQRVALRTSRGVYSLNPPKRHHDLIRVMYENHGREWTIKEANPANQGFIDSIEGFVSRERAREIAVGIGQVKNPMHGTQLFSEDLW